jgi:hypothetical protein
VFVAHFTRRTCRLGYRSQALRVEVRQRARIGSLISGVIWGSGQSG